MDTKESWGFFKKKKFSVHAHIHVYVEARGGALVCPASSLFTSFP